MTEIQKNVSLDVTGRHRDVRFNIDSRDHGDIFLTITPRETQKEQYEGPYTVSSAVNGLQILDTENKVMVENMVVLPIPYFETSNPKGGLTIYIGGE